MTGGCLETLLTKDSFQHYLKDSRVKAFPAPGISGGKLLLDPLNKTISLSISVGVEPDLTLSERLRWETHEISPGGKLVGQLVLQADEELYEGYLLVADIVAEFSTHNDLGRAVLQSTTKFADLIETEPLLGAEKQIGLLGELLVLKELVDLSSLSALHFWEGPNKSEHDFKFTSADLEVKTTTSERRHHKIGSIRQLMESPGRALNLASIQLTKTSGNAGFSLGEVVADLTIDLAPLQDLFIERLNKAGWRLRHNHLYSMRYSLRSEPIVFQVKESFPRLLPSRLNLEPEQELRITDIEYRINLDNLDLSQPLRGFLRDELGVA